MGNNRRKISWREIYAGSRSLFWGMLGGSLAAALAISFGVRSFQQYRAELIQTEQEQLLIMAETVGSSLVNFVEQELDNINLYFSSMEQQDDLEGIYVARQAAEAFLWEKNGLYTAMACYDPYGENIYQQGNVPLDFQMSEAGKSAAICGKRFCGDHYEMLISRKFYQQKTEYTIVLAMNLEWLYTRIVKPVQIGKGGYSIVKDQELRIIMHHAKNQIGMDAVYDRGQKYPQLSLDSVTEWVSMQAKHTEGVSVIDSYQWDDPDLKEEKRIVAYTTIYLPGESWIVNSTLPFQELEKPLNRMLWRLIGMSSFLAGIVVIFVYLMTRSLMRTVSQKKEIAYLREINEGMELLRRKEEELQHYHRIQSIGQMSSHIAHEFNNYLTPVMIYSGMLQADETISPENLQLVEGILSAATQAADLSRKLLDFSRQDTGVGSLEMDITEEVKKAVDMVRPLTPEGIAFHEELTQEALYVRGRKGMAQQILMNLCNNAYHAMEGKEGILTIRLKRDEGNEESARVCLSVSDTGCGISKEAIDKIFEPFYTTKRSGKGTGLGLSVIFNMMKSAGGEIRVESEVGSGTSFYLYFPLIEPQKFKEDLATGYSDKGQKTNPGRILIVDDDKNMLRALEKRFKKDGWKAECFDHAAAALAKLQNDLNYTDYVLTDYDMPSMNGLEFAQLVRKLNPSIHIVLMSGTEDSQFAWYQKNGFIDRFILKSNISVTAQTAGNLI